MNNLYAESIRQLARRRWLKRIIHPLLPESNYLPVEKGRVYYDVKDQRGPSFYIMYDGVPSFYHYEKENKSELLALLDDQSVFFDIGTNIGLFSLDFKMKIPGLEVHAFEPEALAFKCLDQSVKSFGFSHFKLNNIGLGSSRGELKLYKNLANAGGHSIHGASGEFVRDAQSIIIETLDAYVEKMSIEKIDAIKMDVEGHEVEVIKGGLETFKKFKPALLFECIHDLLDVNDHVIGHLRRVWGKDFLVRCKTTGQSIVAENFEEHVLDLRSRGIRSGDYFVNPRL